MEEGINFKFSDVILITSNLVSELVILQSSASNHRIIDFKNLFCHFSVLYRKFMNKESLIGKRIQNVSGRKKVDHPNSPLFRLNVSLYLELGCYQ